MKKKRGKLIIRIVTLTVTVLCTFALNAQAQVNILTDIRAESAAFVAMGQSNGSAPAESFIVSVNSAARIAEIRQYLAERAAGTERRRLVPTCIVKLTTETWNRNLSAIGTPAWNWEVVDVLSVRRAQPELETYVAYSPEIFSSPSDIEGLLRAKPSGLPENRISLLYFPIVMEMNTSKPDTQSASLINVSDRGFVGTGNQVKITGFVVDGTVPRNVVIRALGPTLATFGVKEFLANPRIEVYRGAEKIAENDDWATGSLNRPHAMVFPAPLPFSLIPGNSREPALELSLPPGSYTVVVSSADGATGVALTEVYSL